MNKGLYKHKDGKCLYWYKTWKNSSENSGATIAIWGWGDYTDNKWNWSNCSDDEDDCGQPIGAACLAQW
jgi:hypothetical protein